MGGTPWRAGPSDPAAVIQVAQSMNFRLARHGLPPCLDPAACYPRGCEYGRRIDALLGSGAVAGGMCPLEPSGLPIRRFQR